MFRNKMRESARLLYSVSIVSVFALALWFGGGISSTSANSEKTANAVPAATFPANAATLGAIPDNAPASPRDVTFTVSGITGHPSNVEVSHTYGGPIHTWAGDVNVWLIAPNGNSFVIYGRTGQTGASAGDSSDLAGPYNMKDSASGTNWWTAANIATGAVPIPAGDYRTTESGPQPVITTSPETNLTAAFSGVTNANGTWTLRFTDNASGDTGAVSAASLTLESAGSAPVRKKNVDFDGDSKSDFSIVRDDSPAFAGSQPRFESIREKLRFLHDNPTENLGGGQGNTATWYIHNSSDNTDTVAGFGDPIADFIVPSDYDGDGKADIAVWRPGSPTVAAFYIFQSSTNTLRTEAFGQTGDDPAITGDYDGDGRSDIAVYRCPPLGGGDGQCYFYFRGSNNNPNGNLTVIPWGYGEQFDFFVNPGDFDGDGKFDFCIQRQRPNAPTEGQFALLRSSDFGVEFIDWGRATDLIVPGDYDGDGKYDFMVSRTNVSNQREYYLLERDGGGTGGSPIHWGIGGDIRTPGDYDGDGKTDVAVWRPNIDPNQNYFYVLLSSGGGFTSFEYGVGSDIPTASWNVH
ncbi:MAG: VCBS repeat-containing protein [Pyrinomonadaceae bacterium]|nr:VCBS repeat-containing protein [Pyrinomonadaceae bacterium]